ncbi:MAG: transcriptional regulator NrdR [Proteobacteria bacterium]|nr:MAG: transcriptional regulator NrdR [Pseudomonadota bacterium]
MKCPRCSSEDLAVIDSRGDDSAIRRRRECQSCHYRFTTYERIEYALPMVVKKDGRREPFDREKIKAGLVRACEKTAVGVEQIDQAVESIESKISELCLKEIKSRDIGEFVMEALKGLDKVAYVRFASVYREFSDVSQFVDTLKSLQELKSAKKRNASGLHRVTPPKVVNS